MTNLFRYVTAGLLLATSMLAARSEAEVFIRGSRVAYPASSKEVTIQLGNAPKALPALVQIWIDDGDINSTMETAKVPFIVSPPIFRIEPGKGQVVRVAYTKEPLPTDKESLFWVNVLEVRPRPDDVDDRNYVQLAVRSRIKLFFRPDGLPDDAFNAPKQLQWKLVDVDGGKGLGLQVHNPSPYHVSFRSVGMQIAKDHIVEADNGMVSPGGTATFPIKGNVSRPEGNVSVQFSTVSDLGATTPFTQPLSLQ